MEEEDAAEAARPRAGTDSTAEPATSDSAAPTGVESRRPSESSIEPAGRVRVADEAAADEPPAQRARRDSEIVQTAAAAAETAAATPVPTVSAAPIGPLATTPVRPVPVTTGEQQGQARRRSRSPAPRSQNFTGFAETRWQTSLQQISYQKVQGDLKDFFEDFNVSAETKFQLDENGTFAVYCERASVRHEGAPQRQGCGRRDP